MSREISFYQKDEIDTKTKFYIYMDNLVTHKESTKTTASLLIIISYIQLISGYFSDQIKLLKDDEIPDNYLKSFKNIIRIKDLFNNSFSTYQIIIYILFFVYIIITIIFLNGFLKTTRKTDYSYSEVILNFFLVTFNQIIFQPALDFCLALFCFGGTTNPNFTVEVTCTLSDKILLLVVMLLTFFFTVFLRIFLSIYYNESFMLSNNAFSRISSKFDIYITINSIIYTLLLNFANKTGPIIFLIYNLILSIVLLKIVLESHSYYDSLVDYLVTYFHILYVWTSVWGIFFFFISGKEISIVYLSIAIVLLLMTYNYHLKFNETITLSTPFHKLENKKFILIYVKNLIKKMNQIETNQEDKAKIIGIIHLHKVECPLNECPSKIKGKKFFLPITEEWSNPGKIEINDRVYLNNFIIFVYDFFISQGYYSPDILINLSLYYLQIIGNFCGAMYYCQKAENEKLSLEEKFFHFRLSNLISKALVKTCKPSNEISNNLEEINTSMYFRYQDLSEKMLFEISSDVTLSIDFWSMFITKDKKRKRLDFNKIFILTDKIRITKQKIESLWKLIFKTYNGCNDLFDLFESYSEAVNDDEIMYRELMKVRNKNFALEGVFNYYKILFHKETGIIIASGDKGKEGMIEKVSTNIESFFSFNEEELKGMNINLLMPRVFAKRHTSFMQRAVNVGEKRIINKTITTYGKDKNNNIISLDIAVKLFPILCERTFFCGMITKNITDDVVLLDKDFNIQGITEKLSNTFGLNSSLFQIIDIPLWLLCKDFINHYIKYMANNILTNSNLHNKTQINQRKGRSSISKTRKSIMKGPRNSSVSSIGFKSSLKGDNHETAQNIQAKTPNENYNQSNQNNENDILKNLEFEINENAEVRWQIKIPKMLRTYFSDDNSESNIESNINYNNDQIEIDDENEKLFQTKPNETSPGANISINSESMSVDKTLQNQINKFRGIFNSQGNQNFSELMKYLDSINSNDNENQNTFNFVISFKYIPFGQNNRAYLLRLIDNKEEKEDSTEKGISEHSRNKDKLNNKKEDNIENKSKNFDKKKYLEGLKKIEEANTQDLKELENNISNFHSLTTEDEEVRKKIKKFHNEILAFSQIYSKDNQLIIDQNGSQSSSGSQFTNSITKKARIQEIKTNILINVESYYTVKFIKFIFSFYIFSSFIFLVIFLIIYDSYIKDNNILNDLHSAFFSIPLYYMDAISITTSLRGLNKILKSNNNDLYFKTYTSIINKNESYNYSEYYYKQKSYIHEIYEYILDTVSIVELNYTNKISKNNNNNIIYNRVNQDLIINSTKNDAQIFISVLNTMGFINSLYKINNQNELPFIYANESDYYKQRKIEYLLRNIIEKSYNNDLPQLIDFMNKITNICSKENSMNVKIIVIILVIYSIISLLTSSIYLLNLYLSNKIMEKGLKLIGRIDPIMIDETIRNIKAFNSNIVSNYKNKGDINANHLNDSFSEDEGNKQIIEDDDKEEEALDEFGFNENNQHKSLKILYWAYFQIFILFAIILIFLIPIFIEIFSLVSNVNRFLETKKYFYDNFIKTELNLLNMKLTITNSNITKLLDYDYTYLSDKKKMFISQINKYTHFDSFYKDKYILSICLILFNIDSTEYKNCKKDLYLSEYCNAQDLISLINDNIYSINKDVSINQNYNEYNYLTEFNKDYFKIVEYLNTIYFREIPLKLVELFKISLFDYTDDKKGNMKIIFIIFIICETVFSIYVILFFMKKLTNFLLISRCVFKIIPTKIINETKELEEWIETQY